MSDPGTKKTAYYRAMQDLQDPLFMSNGKMTRCSCQKESATFLSAGCFWPVQFNKNPAFIQIGKWGSFISSSICLKLFGSLKSIAVDGMLGKLQWDCSEGSGEGGSGYCRIVVAWKWFPYQGQKRSMLLQWWAQCCFASRDNHESGGGGDLQACFFTFISPLL